MPYSLNGRPHALVTLLLVFGLSTGCATYRLTVPDSDPTDTQYEQQTVHVYLWGAFSSPEVVEAKCTFGGDHINDVKVIDHLGFDLISVITLGIWKPITIQWRCKPETGSGPVTFPTGGN